MVAGRECRVRKCAHRFRGVFDRFGRRAKINIELSTDRPGWTNRAAVERTLVLLPSHSHATMISCCWTARVGNVTQFISGTGNDNHCTTKSDKPTMRGRSLAGRVDYSARVIHVNVEHVLWTWAFTPRYTHRIVYRSNWATIRNVI